MISLRGTQSNEDLFRKINLSTTRNKIVKPRKKWLSEPIHFKFFNSYVMINRIKGFFHICKNYKSL